MSIVLHLTKTDNLNLLDASGNSVDLSIEQGADYNKIVIQVGPGDLTTIDPNYNPLSATTGHRNYTRILEGSIRKNYANLEPNEPALTNWLFSTFIYDLTTDLTTIVPILSASQTASLPYTSNRKTIKDAAIPGYNVLVYDLWLGTTAKVDQIIDWGAHIPISQVNLPIPSTGQLINLIPIIEKAFNYQKVPILIGINNLWYFNYDRNGNLINDQNGNPIPAGSLRGITDLALATDFPSNITYAQLVERGIHYIDNQDGTIILLPGTALDNPRAASSLTSLFSFSAHLLLENEKIALGYIEVSPRVTEPNQGFDWNYDLNFTNG